MYPKLNLQTSSLASLTISRRIGPVSLIMLQISALKLSGRSAILTAEGMSNRSELPLFKLDLPSFASRRSLYVSNHHPTGNENTTAGPEERQA